MTDWNEKLADLERRSRKLEPAPGRRRDWIGRAVAYAEHFVDSLPDADTYVADRGQSAELPGAFPEAPADMEELLDQLAKAVDGPGINPASGGHLGYIPGGGIFPAALGDFLADVFNRYSGVHFASPGAVRLERQLVRWMADLVGYPAAAGGDLTSGGSTANLSAIVTAREAKGIRPGNIPRSCIYMSRQVHHCVDKALRVAGLEECPVRFVPMDRRHRMDASMLDEQIRADRANGLMPWLIVASAGTTDSGSIDPLLRISAVAREHDCWFHVDAAYGGFFLLCREGREALPGLDGADSIVMDPHKGLFLPYGSGAVLVRDEVLLAHAHRYQANYMQDATRPPEGYSPADLSAELSRPFRGLRLWLPLKLFGLEPFRAALSEKLWLARYFHERVQQISDFEVGPYPDLSVVTFRYCPPDKDVEKANRGILEAVHRDGKVFISSTRLDGVFTLRVAILHFRTHRREVDYLLDFLAAQTRG